MNLVTAKDAIRIENDLELTHATPGGNFNSNRSNFINKFGSLSDSPDFPSTQNQNKSVKRS